MFGGHLKIHGRKSRSAQSTSAHRFWATLREKEQLYSCMSFPTLLQTPGILLEVGLRGAIFS